VEDKIEGVAKQVFGRVQDALGGLAGDGGTQFKGKVNEATGSAQAAYGQFKDQAEDALDQARDIYEQLEGFAREQPRAALAAAAGIGVILGLLLRSGRRTVYVRR
jgi:uncharacterized protein YjbJ (UPF0337 family)